jgi:hypothetical protein
MGVRFHRDRFSKNVSIKAWAGYGPPRSMKQIFNRQDRRRLNMEVKRHEEPDIPQRWNHKHWGLWKWF